MSIEITKQAKIGTYVFEVAPNYVAVYDRGSGQEDPVITLDMQDATELINWLYNQVPSVAKKEAGQTIQTGKVIEEPVLRSGSDLLKKQAEILTEPEGLPSKDLLAQRSAGGPQAAAKYSSAGLGPMPTQNTTGQKIYEEETVDLAKHAKDHGALIARQ